jgi:glycerol-3-phosphate dehydrogenase (NAD(P)+)
VKFNLRKVAVAGGGAWGTALAVVASHRNRDVTIWTRHADTAKAINETHSNPFCLPDVTLPKQIKAATEASALCDAEALIVALPSQDVQTAMKILKPHLRDDILAISASKGIDRNSDRYTAGIVSDYFGLGKTFILSGPTFAADVARRRPAACVLAGFQRGDTEGLVFAMATPSFRIYSSTDVAGVQVGGLIKNALAIACGIADGMGLGDSARAALITRGSYELLRLGRKLGGQYETLQGLSGLGDLILTATSGQSRNFSLGRELGRGKPLEAARANVRGVCEGVNAAIELAEIATARKVETPIIDSVAAIVTGASTPAVEMERLLGRPLTSEKPVE